MAALAISTSFNRFSIPSYSTKTTSFRRRTSIVSASTNPDNDSSSSSSDLSSKINGLSPKLDQSILLNSGLSNGPIEAGMDNPPIMPAVMTPAGGIDLAGVLFRNRIIFIGQPIDSQVAQLVISQLLTLATIDEKSDILVYLNCPGGSPYSIFAIYDCMSWIKPRVGTVCFGIVASHASLLLAGGEKGMRYAMPNTRIMIHQPISGVQGNIEVIRRNMDESLRTRNKFDQMYAAFTGQPLEKIQDYTCKESYLSATEAMDLGLLDGILETEY